MRIAYFDCFSGISGDMTIAAFLDAGGLSANKLRSELAKLKIKGYRIRTTRVRRGPVSGTKFDCIKDKAATSYRSCDDIIDLIDRSLLSKRVKSISKAIFQNISSAETKAHGLSSKRRAHLHELGDIDSIIDIVGVAIAIDELEIDAVYSSAITLGRTLTDTAHGKIPIPAPATLELLKGIPVKMSGVEAELVTPTGAAILKTLSKGFGKMPQLEIDSVGYGAGTMDPKEMPNMLRLIVGERTSVFNEDKIYVIETNIDDMSPQGVGYLFERLLKEGALDVYTTSIQMKKSRPAFKLTVLAEQSILEKISAAIFKETTTIGIRFYEAERYKLARERVKAHTKFGDIMVKVSKGAVGIRTVTPEYDDCERLAKAKRIPLKLVYEAARSAVKI